MIVEISIYRTALETLENADPTIGRDKLKRARCRPESEEARVRSFGVFVNVALSSSCIAAASCPGVVPDLGKVG